MRVPRIVLGQRVSIAPFWFDAHEADLYRQAYRVLAGNPSVVFVNNSRSSAKEYERWIQLATGTNKIVHNGFLPSSIKIRSRSESAACRASLGLPANKPVVGALMRFAPEKDPDLWLETAAAIASVRSDVYFLLAGYGHGAIADQLLQKGAERDLGSRLVVPGVVTDVGQVYGALDVHFLTSRTENLPNVMIEAQAAGIPVVGPDVGGIGEAMIDGVTGVLVRDRSAGALARAVLRILDDPRWRERAAVEGPIFVSRTFDQERMIREMIAIYRGQQPVWRRWLKWPTRSLSKIDSSPTSARFVYRGSREQDRYRGQPLPAEPQRLTSHRDAEAMKTNRPIELGDGTTVPAGAAVIFVRGYGYAIRDPHLYGIDKHVAAYHYVFVQPIAVDGKERQ
jgi:hypothetical protein